MGAGGWPLECAFVCPIIHSISLCDLYIKYVSHLAGIHRKRRRQRREPVKRQEVLAGGGLAQGAAQRVAHCDICINTFWPLTHPLSTRPLQRYGSAYLITSISLAIISYALCYSLIDAGVDVAAVLRQVRASESRELLSCVRVSAAAVLGFAHAAHTNQRLGPASRPSLASRSAAQASKSERPLWRTPCTRRRPPFAFRPPWR